MRNTSLFESLDRKVGSQLSSRRYSLPEMISESYKSLYNCEAGTNLHKLVESHLEDVRNNPADIDRLSRQLSLIKEISRMVESNQLKDEDLVAKENFDKPTPRKERVMVKKECNESAQERIDDEDEDLLEDTELTDEEVEELQKHLAEIRKNKKTQESCKESTEELKEEATKKGYKVLQLIMDVAFPADLAAGLKGSISSGSEFFNAISGALEEHGLEMAGDMIDIDADVTDIYVDNEYEFFECDDPKKTPMEEARDFEFDQSLWAVVKDDGSFAGVPCTSEEEAYQLAANHEGSAVFRLTVNTNESRSKNPTGKSLDEARYGSGEMTTDDMRDLADKLTELAEGLEDLGKNSLRLSPNTYGIYPPFVGTSEGYLGLSDIDRYLEDDEEDEFEESKKVVKESTEYNARSLQEFSKKSKDKAFMKTFKKMNDQLKEGKALTRQESINLYKAANSALTHLSVELEHNPEFLGTFKESVSILASDVNKLLGSLSEGKAPSKNTMKSLAKFSEALLNEEDEEEDLPPIEDEIDAEAENPEEETAEEEVDEFDQEYADARVDLHNELVDKHEGDEDPIVQDKLAQDAEEVATLPGVSDEQREELLGETGDEEEPSEEEEIPEESEEDTDEAADPKKVELDDESEITDDELAELKKYLKEMRSAKR